MRLSQAFRRQRTKVFRGRIFDHTVVNQLGDGGQQFMLFDHIGRFKHRPGKHEFIGKAGRFRLEQIHIMLFRCFGNRHNPSLRGNDFGHHVKILIGFRCAENVINRSNIKGGQFILKRTAMIDHLIRTQFFDPLNGLIARCGGNHV